jgi:hypothetical protein
VTASLPRIAVAVLLNSSPSKTLPKPLSLTVTVPRSPEMTCRCVEIVNPRGPSKRMAKVGLGDHPCPDVMDMEYSGMAGS